MATYYVLITITSAWQGDRWRAVERTDDKEWAEYLASALERREPKFKLAENRLTKVLSKTALLREYGAGDFAAFERDIERGWTDAPIYKDAILRGFGFDEVMDEKRKIREAFEHEKKSGEEKETVDFLLRDIPADLHREIKVRAATDGITMQQWMLNALRREAFKSDRPCENCGATPTWPVEYETKVNDETTRKETVYLCEKCDQEDEADWEAAERDE